MTDEEADWVFENVLDHAPDAFVAGGNCRCQGPARLCCLCRGGLHDMCEGFTFRYEGYVFNARFSWPPLADLFLAGRLCKKACTCTACHPTQEQLDLFGVSA